MDSMLAQNSGGSPLYRQFTRDGDAIRIWFDNAGKALKVRGIVLKNSDPAYLLDCLDSVRAGRTWIDPDLAKRTRQLVAAPLE